MNELLTELDDLDRETARENDRVQVPPGMWPNRLPEVSPQGASEPAAFYGLRILMYLMAHEITVTLSDEQLELADHAAVYATAPHDVPLLVVSKISRIKHLIADVLAMRAREREREQGQAVRSVPEVVPQRPNEGPMARLESRLPVLPNQGQRVRIDF